jgi:hypothetical protein
MLSLFVLLSPARAGAPPAPAGSDTREDPAGGRLQPEGTAIYAIAPPTLFRHDIGELDLMTTNLGVFGKANFIDGFGAGWRGDEYLYVAGLWIGAIASDNLPYVSTGAYEFELRPSLDAVDTVYPSFEGIQNGNRIGYSDEADDDADGRIDEDFNNGKDDDGDGLIDEDFGAVSEQMFSCEYWDYTPEAQQTYPEHRPLNLLVRERSFAWSIPELDGFVGFEYEITNVGFETLRDLYVGLFVDGDVGPPEAQGYYGDDGGFYFAVDTTLVDPTLPGCSDVPLRLQMAYMYDIPDGEIAHGGDAPGFAGLVMLGHTTDPLGRRAPQEVRVGTCRIFSGSGPYPAGDPRNDFERYDLMSAHGMPARPTGLPDDYRYYIGTDRFPVLLPGESIILEVGYVVGEGYIEPGTNTPHPDLTTEGIPGDESLVAAALRARLAFQGRWKDLDGQIDTGVDGRETCIATAPDDPFHWIDPCGGPSKTFAGSVCTDPYAWVDNDCDPCTPNPFHEDCAQGGCETLVHWYVPPVQGLQPGSSGALAGAGSSLIVPENPATPPIRIRLTAPARDLAIYDAAGRHIRSFDLQGLREISWDGRNTRGEIVAPGMYFLRVAGSSIAGTGRLVILE